MLLCNWQVAGKCYDFRWIKAKKVVKSPFNASNISGLLCQRSITTTSTLLSISTVKRGLHVWWGRGAVREVLHNNICGEERCWWPALLPGPSPASVSMQRSPGSIPAATVCYGVTYWAGSYLDHVWLPCDQCLWLLGSCLSVAGGSVSMQRSAQTSGSRLHHPVQCPHSTPRLVVV